MLIKIGVPVYKGPERRLAYRPTIKSLAIFLGEPL